MVARSALVVVVLGCQPPLSCCVVLSWLRLLASLRSACFFPAVGFSLRRILVCASLAVFCVCSPFSVAVVAGALAGRRWPSALGKLSRPSSACRVAARGRFLPVLPSPPPPFGLLPFLGLFLLCCGLVPSCLARLRPASALWPQAGFSCCLAAASAVMCACVFVFVVSVGWYDSDVFRYYSS